jgi:dTDP-4-dehydrorhamnose 3,5-epimerase
MLFEPVGIVGATLVKIDPHRDERGFFARTFCVQEFEAQGLPGQFVQASVSYNERRGTVRGMHFQWPPSREGKLVRCLRGSLFDVLLDLRPDSPTYLMHHSVCLDQDSRDAVFIPHGVAHGFQTLADRTEVLYQMTDFFVPGLGAGVRWNDPVFAIAWPLSELVINAKDTDWPDFQRQTFEAELARHAQQAARAA